MSGPYRDAWGRECDEPTQCWECNGNGLSYDETCCTCGGQGKICHPADAGTREAPDEDDQP